jgi:copper chaperone CopZ
VAVNVKIRNDMKNLLPSCCLLLSLCALPGCGNKATDTAKPFIISLYGFRADIRTVTIEVPAMKSLDCSRRVQDALAKTEGVRSTTPDVNARRVDIQYDAIKLGIKNLEYVIAGAGFDAGATKAPAEARNALPGECR